MQLPGLFRSDGSIGGIVNETIVLSDSEYIANAGIYILDGGSLTIGPNAKILFASDCSVIVRDGGVLSVDGPVALEPQAGVVWGGIILDTANQTSISDALILGSSVGVHAKSSGNVSISHSALKDITSRAVYVEASSASDQVITLSNVHIDSPEGDAINAPSFSGSLTFFNSSITNASGYGIYVYSSYYDRQSQILIEKNLISMIEYSYTSVYARYYGNMTMRDNELTCQRQCLYLDQGDDTLVNDNIFSGVPGVLTYHQQAYINGYVSGLESFSVQGNTFRYWQTSSYDALYVYLRQSSSGTGDIALKDNMFYNITAGTIFKLDFYGAASPVNIANVFKSNLEASSSSCPSALCVNNWPSSCGTGVCTLMGNIFNFSAPEDQYHLSIKETVTSTIDASLSYWGAADEANLTDAIFDGRDDIELTTVLYLPYLLTEDPEGDKRCE